MVLSVLTLIAAACSNEPAENHHRSDRNDCGRDDDHRRRNDDH